MNAAQVIQNSGSATDRNCSPEARALQARNSLNRDGLNLTRAAYQDFFALWKDADRDIPILKQAKAEYAKFK
jgi:hypothetical protein